MRIFNRSPVSRRATKLVATALIVAAAASALAACGSSGSSGRSGSGNGSQSTQQSTQSRQTTRQSPSATLETTKVSGYGTVLATAKGDPVYLLTADPSGGSRCTGACASAWPPLTATGKPTGAAGVNASMLSTLRRSDGAEQVLYDGHALYTRPGLSATAAAGTAADGGIWYLVSPSGQPVTKTSGSGY
jgi:predicted lipoprotein with Yx(FWY)xxD motif